jgi:hypothetical protein
MKEVVKREFHYSVTRTREIDGVSTGSVKVKIPYKTLIYIGGAIASIFSLVAYFIG